SFWPWRFLSLAAPDLFGSPAAGNYWGYGAFWEDAVYIGLLPLLLATRAIARALWPRNQAVGPGRDQSASIDQADLRALSIGLAVLVLLSFTLALGSNTPVFPWLYRNVPGFDMFQAPTRISIWAVTALAILASIGVQGWRAQEGRGLYWSRLGTAGAAAVMGAAALGWFLLDIEQNSFFLAMAKAGFWGFLFGILTLRAPQPEVRNPGGRWAWAVTLVLAADLLLAGWGLNPAVDLDFYRRPSQSAEAVAAGLGEGRLYLAPADEYDLKFNRLFTFSSFDPGEDWGNARAVLLPNLHMLDGILHTANFDPILPGRYVQWMDTLESAPGDTSSRLLNLSGVSVVEIADLDTEAGVRFDSQSDGTRFRWYTCALHAESGQDALDLLVDGDRRLEHLVVIEKPIEDEPADCGTSSAQIDLIVDESDQIILHLNTENDGWLLIADTWYPGWSAEVDGEPVEILRANFLFRAVEISEGAHEVEFVYRPQSFQWGLVITAVTVLCLAITAGFTAWRRETL
ncbi:MAG: YfhO family protein, partial [Anaerolineales bacterium]|nr:YfhO family protein [Anaerolineales bacterium]